VENLAQAYWVLIWEVAAGAEMSDQALEADQPILSAW
jgi:hypothetical protein